MNLRSIVALFMGLVIQLSQMQTAVAAESQKTCGTSAHAMDCCEGLIACPCATQSEQNEKPIPLLPATVELKLFVAKALGSSDFEAIHFQQTVHMRVSKFRPELSVGYAGVPLSVAFCSFVI